MTAATAAWISLALIVAGFGWAFGVRSFVAWKATGDTGLRTATGPAGSASWWAKLLFLAAIFLIAAAPVTVLAGLPVLTANSAVQTIGLVVAVVAGIFTALAQAGMGTSWRVGVDAHERTALVTTGLFSFARNPIFTAMTIFAGGLAMLSPTVVSVAAVFVLAAAVQLQARRVEEPYLVATHGEQYLRYAAKVGRFIPFAGRLPNPARGA